jgi:rhodanese-related sulfurtransferase
VVVEGGTEAWIAAGLPVDRGTVTAISLERQVRIAAGALVLLGVLLGWLVHPAFFGLSGFVGAGLVFAGITDFCGMGLLLARMPWNNRAHA